jgi:hypothetical protein
VPSSLGHGGSKGHGWLSRMFLARAAKWVLWFSERVAPPQSKSPPCQEYQVLDAPPPSAAKIRPAPMLGMGSFCSPLHNSSVKFLGFKGGLQSNVSARDGVVLANFLMIDPLRGHER